jgi:DNA-binding transcriptional regulator YhcF (GntR family)
MASGSLPKAIEAMKKAGFENKDFKDLLTVNGSLTAMASGSLPKAIEAMKKAGFENKDFKDLLTVNGTLTAMANGSLPKAIEAMKKAGFENKDFMGLLTVKGALTAMANGSLILATETLRREGVHGNLWSMVLRRNGILSHLASGDFSIVTSRLDSLALHQAGSDPIYSSTAFWQAIPFILSHHFFTCQQELGIVTEGEEKNDTDRKRQGICCQHWRAAIREKRFLDARRILSSKHAPKIRKVVTRKTRKTRKMDTFEKEITSQLFSICQDHSKWSSTGAVLEKILGSPIGIVWRESGYDRTSLTNFIHRLKQKRTKEALLATRGNATVKDVRSKALEMKTKT